MDYVSKSFNYHAFDSCNSKSNGDLENRENMNLCEERSLVGSKATKRNTSITIATMFFAIFGILAIVIGIVDIMNPPYPYAQRLPLLGHIALIVGILSLVATSLLWKLKRLGGYVGIISFMIAYAVNVYVGENPMLHAMAGVIAGLMLFIPLAIGWKTLS